ncbi:hypothetical protein TNCV_2479541 [Trichonephila clavipes]|nr:hypothetical protein TNCV_2479541 [Trichonephila clavipes]
MGGIVRGRYVVPMALNEDPSCLGNSKDIAIRRLNSLWKRLSQGSGTLQQLAKDEKSRFPLASETLLYDTYMDDIVSGAKDLERLLNNCNHQLKMPCNLVE